MYYEISLEDNFTEEDYRRAFDKARKRYKEKTMGNEKETPFRVEKIRRKKFVTLRFYGSLWQVLTFLEYLLESGIRMDQENRIWQDGHPTDSYLDVHYDDERA